ncbi:cell division protein FtsQ/DivIB [Pseudomaricurvus sp.]|uniref:cell division protein FtsQ/DivIB n=1 Tax=Pseudomaricurvus sp. TaxID=2004510 RepID=UPI003F6CF41C
MRSNKKAVGGEYGKKLLRWLGVFSIAGVVVIGCYGVGSWAISQLDRPVTSVKINGEFTRISQKEVAESVYDAMADSFMKLDLGQIQQQLEQKPWVDHARVARRWPGELEVTVVEHKPIARWGDADALNHRGEVIRLSDKDAASVLLKGLPELSGEEGLEQEMMAQYQVLNKLLTEYGMSVKKLTCSAARSWTITLSDDVVIRVGRDEMLAKMGRFLTVYKAQLQARWTELSSIDLRYYNGVAVQWREPASV